MGNHETTHVPVETLAVRAHDLTERLLAASFLVKADNLLVRHIWWNEASYFYQLSFPSKDYFLAITFFAASAI